MRQEMWPNVLMLCGFGAAAIFLGLLLFAPLSPTGKVVASIAENIGIGVGSIGMGNRIAQAKFLFSSRIKAQAASTAKPAA